MPLHGKILGEYPGTFYIMGDVAYWFERMRPLQKVYGSEGLLFTLHFMLQNYSLLHVIPNAAQYER